MRYSGGDPNMGNSAGMEILNAGIPFSRFGPVPAQKQINQYNRIDAVRTLGNMAEAQRSGFANKFVS